MFDKGLGNRDETTTTKEKSSHKKSKKHHHNLPKPKIVDFDLTSDDCFCSRKKCFALNSKGLRGKDIKETFTKIFFLIGKALDDTRPPVEKSDSIKQRKTLLRIEKMYSFAGSFFQKDLYIGNVLAKTLID